MLADNPTTEVSSIASLNDEFLNYAKESGFGDIHLKIDSATGLVAIIAIHNTNLGPALGGCRLRDYANINEAFLDVMRLAKGMSYKSALADLPLGGGKAVIIKPSHIVNRERYFEAFGRFIQELNGRYITAVDIGTSPTDMDSIAHTTRFVSSTTKQGDPSPFTAAGIRYAIQAAVKFKLGKDSLKGIHIAIQGLGHVGYYLSRELHVLGARLTVCDINPLAIEKCVKEFGATEATPDQIHMTDCDVYSPCALGATLNAHTIPEIKAPIVVGGANNQLAEAHHGILLHQRGILYGPDYAVNAGGVIHAASEYLKTPLEVVNQQVSNIYQVLLNIFVRSAQGNLPTSEIADIIAEEKLYAGEHS
jgi:leucine dehydrogenase